MGGANINSRTINESFETGESIENATKQHNPQSQEQLLQKKQIMGLLDSDSDDDSSHPEGTIPRAKNTQSRLS